ncbi:MAG: hypothetical protein KY469_10895 [Actinobacteria bacterium]|nr:hypothetical protein [Actinomycetota bacterium]
MQFRTATVYWNKEQESVPQTLHDVEVALEGDWVRIRRDDGGETSYPSRRVDRIEWGNAEEHGSRRDDG